MYLSLLRFLICLFHHLDDFFIPSTLLPPLWCYHQQRHYKKILMQFLLKIYSSFRKKSYTFDIKLATGNDEAFALSLLYLEDKLLSRARLFMYSTSVSLHMLCIKYFIIITLVHVLILLLLLSYSLTLTLNTLKTYIFSFFSSLKQTS